MLQVQKALQEMDYLVPFQSGFRYRFGTKAALIMLVMAWTGANRDNIFIVLLALSSSFDAINHGSLLG